MCCDRQESQDSKEGDAEGETNPKPGPEAAARAAGATAKAAAQQREAPPPKAKAGDPAAGGTLTEKEGRSTGAPLRARAAPADRAESPRRVPGAWGAWSCPSFLPCPSWQLVLWGAGCRRPPHTPTLPVAARKENPLHETLA